MAKTIFEQIGGKDAINAAVDLFYKKVLADSHINIFFKKTDMNQQRGKLKAFLTLAFGGPNHYTGKNLRDGHAHLVAMGLNDSHFDAVVKHLGNTLKELGVSDTLISEVKAIAETTRSDILAG